MTMGFYMAKQQQSDLGWIASGLIGSMVFFYSFFWVLGG